MRTHYKRYVMMAVILLGTDVQAQELRYVQVQTANGIVEGVVSPDNKVRTFKGIPYAAPPVGPLRWKAPQPAPSWNGVRKTVEYPPRAMQGRIYSDMVFHDDGPSEDCLYLNLWMPEADRPAGKLPVMVWIHGGGFIAGSTSEPRQDAGNLSKKGVLVVTLTYRLGIFGFYAHPALAKESTHNASGNYGLLDQVAALQWVKENIATFGGDPDNVTIFGESAGSFSVSALMASPLANGLFKRAIGESGAFFGHTLASQSRADAEKSGVDFARTMLGTDSLEALRAMPAEEILEAALKIPQNSFLPVIDGYFLPADCRSIYAAGKQSHVPLLAGWNRDEGGAESFFNGESLSIKNYETHARSTFGSRAPEFLKVYPAATDSEARRAAADYEGDEFIGFSTWKWLEMHGATGESQEFRYEFDQTLPLSVDATPGTEAKAPHSSEIEFVFLVISSKNLPWRQADRDVSEQMASYWTNFARTGNPNGPNLPLWPAYTSNDGYQVMHISANTFAAPDIHRERYEFLDTVKIDRRR